MVFSFNIYSQWSSNPMVNLQVSDLGGDQATPRIALTTDGGCYIAWFDHRTSNYDVYIQRLNSQGVKQFAPDGLLVSSNTQNSSLVGYDLAVDNNNNAILTFTDIRNGGAINPFAYMITPAGTFAWGANGVTLTDSTASFQPNPKVAVTSDGNYVFVWRIGTGPQKIYIQKLNAAGVKQWGTNPILITSGTNENYDWTEIVPSDNGSIIMMFSGYTGTFISPSNYRIYSQKFSSTGSRVWNGTQDTVYSLGRVSGFYNPRVFPDGNNGAVYMWQDDRNLTNLSTTFIQRKNSAGAIQFPVNGSAVSTLGGNNHFSGSVAVFSNGETVAFYTETNAVQSMRGIYGQRLSTNGTRQWSDNGKEFTPLSTTAPSFLQVYTRDTNAVLTYMELLSGTNTVIKGFRTGLSGTFLWSTPIVTASSINSEKIRMQSILNSIGMSILTWSDRRNDGGGVYAQNINYDGSIGLVGIIKITNEIPQSFSLSQNYPNPFNPSTKFKVNISEFSSVSLIVYNSIGKEVKTLVRQNLQLGSYEISFDAANFPSGIYFYKLIAGDYTRTKKMILVK